MGGGGPVLVRRDVWTLSNIDPWHPTIAWYATGVGALMQNANIADPSSWLYLANIHGTVMDDTTWPRGVAPRGWNACQHSSWYFMPWHRMYLHYFEKAVRAAIVAQGGPATWALPFWFYDQANPHTLSLPPAFRAPTLPDGTANPLYRSQRNTQPNMNMNAGEPIPSDVLDPPIGGFSSVFVEVPPAPSFGGPVTGWHHEGGGSGGQLEGGIHGNVHVFVGGWTPTNGLMRLFVTAGQDPIFWLHHANIDRMWEVWRGDPSHTDPTAAAWLTRPYDFGSGAVHLRLTVQDVLDTTAAPLLYTYEGVPAPGATIPPTNLALAGPPFEPGGPIEEAMPDQRPAQLVGATDGPIALHSRTSHATIAMTPREPADAFAVGPQGLGVDASPAARHTYLTLENVTGSELSAGSYSVYVNVPEEKHVLEHPDQKAGHFSMFGVTEASQPEQEHGGSGLNFSFDITGLARRLQDSGDWDPKALHVSVAPTAASPEETAVDGDVKIGRIGVYQD